MAAAIKHFSLFCKHWSCNYVCSLSVIHLQSPFSKFLFTQAQPKSTSTEFCPAVCPCPLSFLFSFCGLWLVVVIKLYQLMQEGTHWTRYHLTWPTLVYFFYPLLFLFTLDFFISKNFQVIQFFLLDFNCHSPTPTSTTTPTATQHKEG